MFQTFSLIKSNADVLMCLFGVAAAVLVTTLQVTVFSLLIFIGGKVSGKASISNPFSSLFRQTFQLFTAVVALAVSAASAALSLLIRFWVIAVLAITFSVVAVSVNDAVPEIVHGADQAYSGFILVIQYSLYPLLLVVDIVLTPLIGVYNFGLTLTGGVTNAVGWTALECTPSLANGTLTFANGTRTVIQEAVRYASRGDRALAFEMELEPGIYQMSTGVSTILKDFFGCVCRDPKFTAVVGVVAGPFSERNIAGALNSAVNVFVGTGSAYSNAIRSANEADDGDGGAGSSKTPPVVLSRAQAHARGALVHFGTALDSVVRYALTAVCSFGVCPQSLDIAKYSPTVFSFAAEVMNGLVQTVFFLPLQVASNAQVFADTSLMCEAGGLGTQHIFGVSSGKLSMLQSEMDLAARNRAESARAHAETSATGACDALDAAAAAAVAASAASASAAGSLSLAGPASRSPVVDAWATHVPDAMQRAACRYSPKLAFVARDVLRSIGDAIYLAARAVVRLVNDAECTAAGIPQDSPASDVCMSPEGAAELVSEGLISPGEHLCGIHNVKAPPYCISGAVSLEACGDRCYTMERGAPGVSPRPLIAYSCTYWQSCTNGTRCETYDGNCTASVTVHRADGSSYPDSAQLDCGLNEYNDLPIAGALAALYSPLRAEEPSTTNAGETTWTGGNTTDYRMILKNNLCMAPRYSLVPGALYAPPETTLEQCSDKCFEKIGCKFFIYGHDFTVYAEDQRGVGGLVCQEADLINSACPSGYYTTSGQPPPTYENQKYLSPPPPPPAPTLLLENSTYGAPQESVDIGSNPTSLAVCQEACRDNDGCQVFSYRPVQSGASFTFASNGTCGNISTSSSSVFLGRQATPQECATRCADSEGCDFFSITSRNTSVLPFVLEQQNKTCGSNTTYLGEFSTDACGMACYGVESCTAFRHAPQLALQNSPPPIVEVFATEKICAGDRTQIIPPVEMPYLGGTSAPPKDLCTEAMLDSLRAHSPTTNAVQWPGQSEWETGCGGLSEDPDCDKLLQHLISAKEISTECSACFREAAFVNDTNTGGTNWTHVGLSCQEASTKPGVATMTFEECSDACRHMPGCSLFNYAPAGTELAGKCFAQADPDCKKLVGAGATCKKDDTYGDDILLGVNVGDTHDCFQLCNEFSGGNCTYFSLGTSTADKGYCYMENVLPGGCDVIGTDSNIRYDLYERKAFVPYTYKSNWGDGVCGGDGPSDVELGQFFTQPSAIVVKPDVSKCAHACATAPPKIVTDSDGNSIEYNCTYFDVHNTDWEMNSNWAYRFPSVGKTGDCWFDPVNMSLPDPCPYSNKSPQYMNYKLVRESEYNTYNATDTSFRLIKKGHTCKNNPAGPDVLLARDVETVQHCAKLCEAQSATSVTKGGLPCKYFSLGVADSGTTSANLCYMENVPRCADNAPEVGYLHANPDFDVYELTTVSLHDYSSEFSDGRVFVAAQSTCNTDDTWTSTPPTALSQTNVTIGKCSELCRAAAGCSHFSIGRAGATRGGVSVEGLCMDLKTTTCEDSSFDEAQDVWKLATPERPEVCFQDNIATPQCAAATGWVDSNASTYVLPAELGDQCRQQPGDFSLSATGALVTTCPVAGPNGTAPGWTPDPRSTSYSASHPIPVPGCRKVTNTTAALAPDPHWSTYNMSAPLPPVARRTEERQRFPGPSYGADTQPIVNNTSGFSNILGAIFRDYKATLHVSLQQLSGSAGRLLASDRLVLGCATQRLVSAVDATVFFGWGTLAYSQDQLLHPTIQTVSDVDTTPPMAMLRAMEDEYFGLQQCLSSAVSAVVYGGGAERCALNEVELPPLNSFSETFCRPNGHEYIVSEDILCQVGDSAVGRDADKAMATARFGTEIFLHTLKTSIVGIQMERNQTANQESESDFGLKVGKAVFKEAAEMARAGIDRLAATVCVREQQRISEFNAVYMLVSLPLGGTDKPSHMYSSANARALTVASLAVQRIRDAMSMATLSFMERTVVAFEAVARTCDASFIVCAQDAAAQTFSSIEDVFEFAVETVIGFVFELVSALKMIIRSFMGPDNVVSPYMETILEILYSLQQNVSAAVAKLVADIIQFAMDFTNIVFTIISDTQPMTPRRKTNQIGNMLKKLGEDLLTAIKDFLEIIGQLLWSIFKELGFGKTFIDIVNGTCKVVQVVVDAVEDIVHFVEDVGDFIEDAICDTFTGNVNSGLESRAGVVNGGAIGFLADLALGDFSGLGTGPEKVTWGDGTCSMSKVNKKNTDLNCTDDPTFEGVPATVTHAFPTNCSFSPSQYGENAGITNGSYASLCSSSDRCFDLVSGKTKACGMCPATMPKGSVDFIPSVFRTAEEVSFACEMAQGRCFCAASTSRKASVSSCSITEGSFASEEALADSRCTADANCLLPSLGVMGYLNRSSATIPCGDCNKLFGNESAANPAIQDAVGCQDGVGKCQRMNGGDLSVCALDPDYRSYGGLCSCLATTTEALVVNSQSVEPRGCRGDADCVPDGLCAQFNKTHPHEQVSTRCGDHLCGDYSCDAVLRQCTCGTKPAAVVSGSEQQHCNCGERLGGGGVPSPLYLDGKLAGRELRYISRFSSGGDGDGDGQGASLMEAFRLDDKQGAAFPLPAGSPRVYSKKSPFKISPGGVAHFDWGSVSLLSGETRRVMAPRGLDMRKCAFRGTATTQAQAQAQAQEALVCLLATPDDARLRVFEKRGPQADWARVRLENEDFLPLLTQSTCDMRLSIAWVADNTFTARSACFGDTLFNLTSGVVHHASTVLPAITGSFSFSNSTGGGSNSSTVVPFFNDSLGRTWSFPDSSFAKSTLAPPECPSAPSAAFVLPADPAIRDGDTFTVFAENGDSATQIRVFSPSNSTVTRAPHAWTADDETGFATDSEPPVCLVFSQTTMEPTSERGVFACRRKDSAGTALFHTPPFERLRVNTTNSAIATADLDTVGGCAEKCREDGGCAVFHVRARFAQPRFRCELFGNVTGTTAAPSASFRAAPEGWWAGVGTADKWSSSITAPPPETGPGAVCLDETTGLSTATEQQEPDVLLEFPFEEALEAAPDCPSGFTRTVKYSRVECRFDGGGAPPACTEPGGLVDASTSSISTTNGSCLTPGGSAVCIEAPSLVANCAPVVPLPATGAAALFGAVAKKGNASIGADEWGANEVQVPADEPGGVVLLGKPWLDLGASAVTGAPSSLLSNASLVARDSVLRNVSTPLASSANGTVSQASGLEHYSLVAFTPSPIDVTPEMLDESGARVRGTGANVTGIPQPETRLVYEDLPGYNEIFQMELLRSPTKQVAVGGGGGGKPVSVIIPGAGTGTANDGFDFTEMADRVTGESAPPFTSLSYSASQTALLTIAAWPTVGCNASLLGVTSHATMNGACPCPTSSEGVLLKNPDGKCYCAPGNMTAAVEASMAACEEPGATLAHPPVGLRPTLDSFYGCASGIYAKQMCSDAESATAARTEFRGARKITVPGGEALLVAGWYECSTTAVANTSGAVVAPSPGMGGFLRLNESTGEASPHFLASLAVNPEKPSRGRATAVPPHADWAANTSALLLRHGGSVVAALSAGSDNSTFLSGCSPLSMNQTVVPQPPAEEIGTFPESRCFDATSGLEFTETNCSTSLNNTVDRPTCCPGHMGLYDLDPTNGGAWTGKMRCSPEKSPSQNVTWTGQCAGGRVMVGIAAGSNEIAVNVIEGCSVVQRMDIPTGSAAPPVWPRCSDSAGTGAGTGAEAEGSFGSSVVVSTALVDFGGIFVTQLDPSPERAAKADASAASEKGYGTLGFTDPGAGAGAGDQELAAAVRERLLAVPGLHPSRDPGVTSQAPGAAKRVGIVKRSVSFFDNASSPATDSLFSTPVYKVAGPTPLSVPADDTCLSQELAVIAESEQALTSTVSLAERCVPSKDAVCTAFADIPTSFAETNVLCHACLRASLPSISAATLKCTPTESEFLDGVAMANGGPPSFAQISATRAFWRANKLRLTGKCVCFTHRFQNSPPAATNRRRVLGHDDDGGDDGDDDDEDDEADDDAYGTGTPESYTLHVHPQNITAELGIGDMGYVTLSPRSNALNGSCTADADCVPLSRCGSLFCGACAGQKSRCSTSSNKCECAPINMDSLLEMMKDPGNVQLIADSLDFTGSDACSRAFQRFRNASQANPGAQIQEPSLLESCVIDKMFWRSIGQKLGFHFWPAHAFHGGARVFTEMAVSVMNTIMTTDTEKGPGAVTGKYSLFAMELRSRVIGAISAVRTVNASFWKVPPAATEWAQKHAADIPESDTEALKKSGYRMLHTLGTVATEASLAAETRPLANLLKAQTLTIIPAEASGGASPSDPSDPSTALVAASHSGRRRRRLALATDMPTIEADTALLSPEGRRRLLQDVSEEDCMVYDEIVAAVTRSTDYLSDHMAEFVPKTLDRVNLYFNDSALYLADQQKDSSGLVPARDQLGRGVAVIGQWASSASTSTATAATRAARAANASNLNEFIVRHAESIFSVDISSKGRQLVADIKAVKLPVVAPKPSPISGGCPADALLCKKRREGVGIYGALLVVGVAYLAISGIVVFFAGAYASPVLLFFVVTYPFAVLLYAYDYPYQCIPAIPSCLVGDLLDGIAATSSTTQGWADALRAPPGSPGGQEWIQCNQAPFYLNDGLNVLEYAVYRYRNESAIVDAVYQYTSTSFLKNPYASACVEATAGGVCSAAEFVRQGDACFEFMWLPNLLPLIFVMFSLLLILLTLTANTVVFLLSFIAFLINIVWKAPEIIRNVIGDEEDDTLFEATQRVFLYAALYIVFVVPFSVAVFTAIDFTVLSNYLDAGGWTCLLVVGGGAAVDAVFVLVTFAYGIISTAQNPTQRPSKTWGVFGFAIFALASAIVTAIMAFRIWYLVVLSIARIALSLPVIYHSSTMFSIARKEKTE